MTKFKVRVVEEITANVEYEIEAESAEEAAQIGHDSWVINGEGSLHEDVNERYVTVDGKQVDIDDGEGGFDEDDDDE